MNYTRAPRRIQRKRTKGWKMPADAVYVGRPSLWGNPYSVQRVEGWARWAGPAPWIVADPHGRVFHPDDDRKPILGRAAADAHGKSLACQKAVDLYVEAMRIFEPGDEFWRPLVGRDLACWCPIGQPCHADALLEILNREVP